jgi:cytochrome c peroxidase
MLTRTRPGSKELLLLLTLIFAISLAGCSTTTEKKAEAPPAYVPEVLPIPPVPPGFESMPEPPDNPTTPEKVALGRQLFFDKRLSFDGSRSCYSCHLNEHGLTDGLPIAVGAGNKQLKRSSPTLWNIGHHKELYWDGRSPTLEAQAMAAWTGGNMGAKGHESEIVNKINASPGYKAQFQAVFGADASASTIMKAITAYERTIVCGDTPWDKFQQGDASAISDEAKRGWEIFRGKAGCGTCHAGVLLTDLQYHNVGVGMDQPKPDDEGRKDFTKDEKDTGAFKTPTLRSVSKSAPYFHNGSKATLEEALDFVLGGGHPNKYLDKKNLKKVKLTEKERGDLLAFLKSLDCGTELKEPKLPD